MEASPIPIDFRLIMVLSQIVYFSMYIFAIYFLVSVIKFMKKKIILDEQRNLQLSLLLKLYTSAQEKH